MNVTICPRPTVEKQLADGAFPENTAVVSFCDPPETREAGYGPVDFQDKAARMIYACLPDIRYEHLQERGYTPKRRM